MLDNKRILNKS